MRILQINKFFYLRGGAERHFFDLSRLLEEKGNEVIHFSMKDERNLKSPYERFFVSHAEFGGFSLSSLKNAGRILYSIEARKKLSALVRETKPDIAHLHLFYHHLSPSILLALRDAEIPVVMTIHDWQVLCPNYSLSINGAPCVDCKKGNYAHVFFSRALKQSYLMSGLAAGAGWLHHRLGWYEKYVNRFIAPSRFAENLFHEYGWPEEKVVHIPHFISEISRHAHQQKKESFLLYAGRLSPEKGIDRLVRAWIRERIPYRLVIAGIGPLQSALQGLVKRNRAGRHIQFLAFVEPENLKIQMQKAQGVIAPSVVWETFGLSAGEAFAEGTGVIASEESGGLAELVCTSGGGLLFSWKRENLGAVVTQYMETPNLAEHLGKTGHVFALERLTRDRYYERVMKVYRSPYRHIPPRWGHVSLLA